MADTLLRLDAFIPYRLSFTSSLVSDGIAATYESLFGLKVPEWRVIAWVAEHDGITQQDICAITRMDKVTVSRAAIALFDRGLLERRPNPADKRSHLLALSAAGVELYAAIAPKALELELRVFARFGKDRLATFVEMLREIDAAVLDMSPDPQPSGAV